MHVSKEIPDPSRWSECGARSHTEGLTRSQGRGGRAGEWSIKKFNVFGKKQLTFWIQGIILYVDTEMVVHMQPSERKRLKLCCIMRRKIAWRNLSRTVNLIPALFSSCFRLDASRIVIPILCCAYRLLKPFLAQIDRCKAPVVGWTPSAGVFSDSFEKFSTLQKQAHRIHTMGLGKYTICNHLVRMKIGYFNLSRKQAGGGFLPCGFDPHPHRHYLRQYW